MNQTPSIVIVSSSNTKPMSLIKLMTRNNTIQNEKEQPEKLVYLWQIDTKYYVADVNLVAINENHVRSEEFNESVEALIVLMDSNKESGLEDLKVWESLENDCEPDIKLLVTNYCTNETKITRNQALEWCLKRGFELIELYPNKTPENNSEDEIIKEKTGVERIIEALQAHVWSNLVMKEKSADVTRTSNNLEGLGNFLTEEGVDDFSELFQQLNVMKENIESMPAQQRKQCAEQVVTAFWRAIGGDEEEMLDL